MKHYGTLPSPPPKKMKHSNVLDSTPPAGPSEPEDLRYDFSVPSPEATQNEYLLEFKMRRRAYLHRILQGEAIGLNACSSTGPSLDIGINLDQEYVNAAALADDPEERDWDDVPADLPSTTPDEDSCGNSFLVVVNISGVHRIPVVWCSCEHANPEYQLLDLRLFPASFANIRTVFTFSVLDDFLTNVAFPNQVPNRYVELQRLSRQGRNLKYLKWHGFGHSTQEPGPGELAIFCPTCPQPGINLPANWRTKYAENELLWTLVVDGNFTADHLRQKRPADNVWLSEGQGMTTSWKPYHDHLKIARETKEKDPCDSNFNALNRANEAVAYKDANGTLGHACGRHGCYCPRSVVDLQKGERQANIDWSLCEALKAINIDDLPRVLLIYDIMCQYHKKLKHRISVSPYLELPDIVIDKAIGLFHVHGHQDSCLFHYATSFILGAAKINGEIMETLWAVLNNIS
ncbi:unnamed protein product [Cyclocybe aegerita]|uniref:CxC2-like cysteine cluster KDZ transposase-associated domain-containing protein n=1 Tax=Cyclocybe aegerita TaxID=1973307 RepID=A0A8S0XRM3_CYCAE|nr:unnamed protein product [Cyclocybe aegerita]